MMAAPDDITGPMNLGNPVETSVAELAHRIIELTGSRSKIVHRPLPVDDPIQRCPDISQAKSVLDWEPHVELATGLARTIAYFDQLFAVRGTAARGKSPALA
jgi:UDP-glucuronate decarboxylase